MDSFLNSPEPGHGGALLWPYHRGIRHPVPNHPEARILGEENADARFLSPCFMILSVIMWP